MNESNGRQSQFSTISALVKLLNENWENVDINSDTPIKIIDKFKAAVRGAELIVEGKDEQFYKELEKPKTGFEPQGLKALAEIASAINSQDRIGYGIPGLDPIVGGGFLQSWITIIGAFSGNGKTSMCIYEAVSLAMRGHPVLFITAELSAPEVYNRLRVAIGNNTDWLENLKVVYPECDMAGITKGIEAWLSEYDSCELTPVIVIDYIQKLKASGKHFSREREVASVCEELQFIGRKFGVPIIAAAQLNRLSQTDDTPRIHHLRETGLIEQIADVALLIQKTASDTISIFVGKNRWGLSDQKIDVTVDFETYRFGTISPQRRWQAFAQEVVDLLKENKGEMTVRQIMQQTRVDKKHPAKYQVIEAGIATGLFKIDDNKCVLTS